MQVRYTDDPCVDYIAKLKAVGTLEDLRTLVTEYRTLANDAYLALPETDEEFDAFQRGVALERRGKFAGKEFADRYSSILMPEIMMRAALFADAWHVPWGLVYNRMVEAGHIVIRDDGIAVMAEDVNDG